MCSANSITFTDCGHKITGAEAKSFVGKNKSLMNKPGDLIVPDRHCPRCDEGRNAYPGTYARHVQSVTRSVNAKGAR